jgi:large subunit ribosomal protein L14e
LLKVLFILILFYRNNKMGDAEISVASWRLVEVGRVVLVHGGPSDGKLATIVEIIDHKRVCIPWCTPRITTEGLTLMKALIDGPSSDEKKAVPRQSIALAQVVLTPLIVEKLPRGARTGAVKAALEKSEIEKKFLESTWAKKRAQKERRRGLTDFERFKVLRLKKQTRFEVRKSLAKIKAAAK